MNTILHLVMLIIATERATELVVSSKFFEPLRVAVKRLAYPIDNPPPDNAIQQFKIALDYFVNCGYCVSVWVSAFIAYLAMEHHEFNWLLLMFFLHGASNLYHVLYELLRRGRVKTYDIVLKTTTPDEFADNVGDNDGL